MARRVIAIVNADSAPMKRLRQDAKKQGTLIDLTEGRKTRSVMILDTHQVVLSTIQPETLTSRLTGTSVINSFGDDEEEK